MLHTHLPQMPNHSEPADGLWARRYGAQLGSLYRVEPAVPDEFHALAARIAARCSACEQLAKEIDDLIIL